MSEEVTKEVVVETTEIEEKLTIESILKEPIDSYSKEERFKLCTILTNALNTTYIQPKFGFKKNRQGERVINGMEGSVTLSQLLPKDNEVVKNKLMELIKSF